MNIFYITNYYSKNKIRFSSYYLFIDKKIECPYFVSFFSSSMYLGIYVNNNNKIIIKTNKFVSIQLNLNYLCFKDEEDNKLFIAVFILIIQLKL